MFVGAAACVYTNVLNFLFMDGHPQTNMYGIQFAMLRVDPLSECAFPLKSAAHAVQHVCV